jgi:hypothetical protein
LELRGHPRKRTYLGGKIVFNANQSLFDCVVKDLSETGARLASDAGSAIPDEFDLRLADGRKFRCEVRWRKPGSVGVAFV